MWWPYSARSGYALGCKNDVRPALSIASVMVTKAFSQGEAGRHIFLDRGILIGTSIAGVEVDSNYLRHGNARFNYQSLRSTQQEEAKAQ